MTEGEFDIAFCEEFPDLKYLYEEWKISDTGLFTVYLVEHTFELVDVRRNIYGFDGNIYSDSSNNYAEGNQYTFDFLKENRDMIAFWFLSMDINFRVLFLLTFFRFVISYTFFFM